MKKRFLFLVTFILLVFPLLGFSQLIGSDQGIIQQVIPDNRDN